MKSLSTPDMPGARVVTYLGPPGSGKTSFSVDRFLTWPRAIAIDSQIVDGTGEYPGIVAYNLAELRELLDWAKGRERWRITYRGSVELPDPNRPKNRPSSEAFFWAMHQLRNVLIVVEETDKFVTPHYTPEGLYGIAHHGRRMGQALSLCARRPAGIPRDLTSTSEEMHAWRPTEPPDIDWLKKAGFPPVTMDALEPFQRAVRYRGPGGVVELKREGGFDAERAARDK